MKCEEFEQALQQQADGCPAPFDESAIRSHAQNCAACRELEDGFRLLAHAFATSRPVDPSAGLSDRILMAVAHRRAPRLLARRPTFWLAAAAILLAVVGLWTWLSTIRSGEPRTIADNSRTATDHSPVTTHHSPASDEPLFPELAATDAVDSRDSVVFLQAVEPVSEILRAISRSLGSPVRPVAASASEAFGNFIRELPDPDSPMMSMPGVREIMPQPMNMKKKPSEMGPSS